MASDPKQPSQDAAGPADFAIELIHDSRTTDLTLTEREYLAKSRRFAFGVLATCSLLAFPAMIYFWYLWVLTAQACINLPLTGFENSVLFNPALATSWQSYLIGLDISSFSALTLALLFTRLTYLGIKNSLHFYWRDRQAYFGRAYHSVLFSEGFETLCASGSASSVPS